MLRARAEAEGRELEPHNFETIGDCTSPTRQAVLQNWQGFNEIAETQEYEFFWESFDYLREEEDICELLTC